MLWAKDERSDVSIGSKINEKEKQSVNFRY